MKLILPLLIVSSLFLSSCTLVGMAAGAGATVGIAAAQEGGISRAVSDAEIQIQINDLWFKYDVETFAKLDLTINQGRVLVTGVVQNPENRVEAIRLAWQPKGVKQVINEVRVADSEGIIGFARDTWITTRIRAALTFNRDIQSINYSIDTVQGTVYLMGFAQSREELNRVIEIARTIKYVKGVVSYVKIVGVDDDAPLSQYDDRPGVQNYSQTPDSAPASYSYDNTTSTGGGAPAPVESEALAPPTPIQGNY